MASGIRQILKSAVRVVAPKDAPAPEPTPESPARPWAAADQTEGNAFTIRVGDKQHKFFFITGCYKSGTHWVQNILNLHPQVNVKGEFHLDGLAKSVNFMTGTHWFLTARPRLRPVMEASLHDFVRRVIYTETRDRPEALWLGDRTPRLLMELIPGAPIINIRRDGRDVMVSWNFHHLRNKRHENLLEQMREDAARMCPDFQANHEKYNEPGTGFLASEWWFRHHARVWAGMIETEFREADAFRDRGTPVLQLVYEDMHKDINASRNAIFGFLGLDPALAAEPSHETRTLVGFSHESPTLFYRKGTTQEWKHFFTENQIRWFKEEAGHALVLAGYEKDLNW